MKRNKEDTQHIPDYTYVHICTHLYTYVHIYTYTDDTHVHVQPLVLYYICSRISNPLTQSSPGNKITYNVFHIFIKMST